MTVHCIYRAGCMSATTCIDHCRAREHEAAPATPQASKKQNPVVERARAARERTGHWPGSHAEALCNEVVRLHAALEMREEQIDGYERQLGIADAGAERTIGSEIERLVALEKVADDLMRERNAHETGDERARMAERLLRSAHRELSLSPDDKALAARIGEWLEGSVPETTAPHPDTVRLEWLLQHVSGKEWRRLGVLYGDGANRTLLNDAMAASQVKSTAPLPDRIMKEPQ